jgi:DNA-binding NarL/FixJ family response regulator
MTEGSRSRPRIVVADDHPQMLEEVARLLQTEFEVVATVPDGNATLTAVHDLKPDVVVLDVMMPGLNGIQTAQQLRSMGAPPKIVFLSIQNDPEYVEAATAMGASYVAKSRMRPDLIVAINEALAGRMFFSKR